MTDQARPYTPTALPSVTARILAFLAILLGGLCGGLIGWSVVDLQCGGDERRITVGGDRPAQVVEEPTGEQRDDDGCTTWAGVGGLIGAVVGAGGVGVVAVLVLRAMAEWRRELDVDEPPLEEPIRPDA